MPPDTVTLQDAFLLLPSVEAISIFALPKPPPAAVTVISAPSSLLTALTFTIAGLLFVTVHASVSYCLLPLICAWIVTVFGLPSAAF